MVAVFALSLGASFLLGRGGLGIFRQGPRFAEHLARLLPPSHDTEGMARTVQQMHDELGIDVSIVDPEGNALASSGAPISLDPSAFGEPRRNTPWILRSSV